MLVIMTCCAVSSGGVCLWCEGTAAGRAQAVLREGAAEV